MLAAVARTVGPLASGYQLLDLCSGKSLTTSIASLRHPGLRCLAVDKMTARLAPHYTGTVEYAEMNILQPGFAALLQARLARAPEPVVMLGMHLCGVLSLKAVELFLALEQVEAAVLAPCCLPSRKHSSVARDAGSKDYAVQYAFWCRLLADRLRGPGVAVALDADDLIESPRNTVITARKLPGFDAAAHRAFHRERADGQAQGVVGEDAADGKGRLG